MKHVLFIGGSIASLVAASHLSNHCKVSLIELHAEVGMPSGQPGFIHDLSLLNSYVSEEQLKFLKPDDNEPGWGLRSEWLTKHLAMNAAHTGTTIHTKTRITSIKVENDQFIVEFQGGGRASKDSIIVDRVINSAHYIPSAPGGMQHTVDEHSMIEYVEPTVTTSWFGGTALTSDCQSLPETAWTFSRSEGLSEVWFEGTPNWQPNHGWIEQIHANLPFSAQHRTIDAQILEGMRLAGVSK